MAPHADAMERAVFAMAMSVAGEEADLRGEVRIPPAQIIAALAPEEAIVLRTSHFGAQLAAAEAGLILADRNLTRVRNVIEMPLAPEPVRGHAVSRQGQVGSRLTS